MVFRIALVLACLAAAPSYAMRPDAELCRVAIGMTERMTGVPDRLMQAVSVMESGRRDTDGSVWPWPWTINVEGVGEVYDSKREVIAAVQRHQAAGARSIDVGCMQVNIKHHPDAFASLEEAFDPVVNARYAARFLQQLLAQTGSWPRAVAGYHSLTPDIGGEYARKVLAIWARPEPRVGTSPTAGFPPLVPAAPPAPPLQTGFSPGISAPVAAMSSAAPARILAAPGGLGPTLTGRTLASYRMMPTRAATMMTLKPG